MDPRKKLYKSFHILKTNYETLFYFSVAFLLNELKKLYLYSLLGIFNVSRYLAQTCHPMPVSGPPHCLSQNGTFCIYKNVDCQNLRKLGEICLGYKYNFRDNYCYFDKRNVSYCIFNDATVARQKYGSFVKHGSYSISFLFL